jgi:hypothetical protein
LSTGRRVALFVALLAVLAVLAGGASLTLLGDPLVDSILALGLAFWLTRREGLRGATAPLLLFVGVVITILLKQVVYQPGPPSEYMRDAVLWPALKHLEPYTFPGGHSFRVGYLVLITAPYVPRCRLVHGRPGRARARRRARVSGPARA